jgi:predicted DNA-binding transcriptional regulator YafY
MEGITGRIFKIVELLQGRGRTTTGNLAVQLGVSERTIRRDLARLQDLDVPVEVTPGRDGGVSLPPGALLPPLRFTDDELLALVLGAKQAARQGDALLERAAARALQRLDAVLTERTRVRVEAEALSTAVALGPQHGSDPPHVDSPVVLELAEAVYEGKRLELHYRSTDGSTSVRQVDPYGIAQLSSRWYLIGYCHLRQGLRTFRLDRVRTFSVTKASFERPADFDPFAAITMSIAQAPSQGDIMCRIRLHASVEAARRWVPATAAVFEPDPCGTLLTVRARSENMERIALYLLELPCRLEVLAPRELREALVALGERAITLGRGVSLGASSSRESRPTLEP